MKFRMSKIAAAIAAATMASSAGAVVVVGGNDGWEISFDGNVNAFYTHFNDDDLSTSATINGTAQATGTSFAAAGADATLGTADDVVAGTVGTTAGEDASRVHSGFLPAFFSFNVKTPTVNGLTGSARFSFAPTIQTAKGGNSVGTSGGLVGANIDTREVVANVEGSFGTVSFGRTLSIFGRQAILHDMTLFGVGNVGGNADFGSVTAGGIAHGYLYPDFQARFSYATPNINGFKAEVGAYDPVEPGAVGGPSANWETTIPRFEGELSYATSFTNGTLMVWGDGMWQETDAANTGFDDITTFGFGGGAEIGYMGFTLTGYYQTLEGTPLGLNKVGAVSSATAATPFAANNITCGTLAGATAVSCEEAEQDEWYVQGTYNFGQGTKVGFRYGEANQDGETAAVAAAGLTSLGTPEVEQDMWSIGVYHDVNSWLKLIAEYNNESSESQTTVTNTSGAAVQGCPTGSTCSVSTEDGWDAFSVGAFVTW